jgi:sugar phosphate isomerase/epimerase
LKLGLYSDSLGQMPLPECLDFARRNGVMHVEIGTGNWSAAPHLDLGMMLESAGRRAELIEMLASRGLTLSALNCSGNPLCPGAPGEKHRDATTKTIALAAMLGLDRIVTMSGCPAGPGDKHPNWITTSWPPETTQILEWQWQEVLLPYWRETVAFARDHGVRLCFEMHGAQCVYNVESFERLREATDETVGVNFDPSHLIWMGADPIEAAQRLAGSIYHVHAKDTRIEAAASSPVAPKATLSRPIVYNGAKQAAGRHRRPGRLRLLRLELGNDDPAAARGGRRRPDGIAMMGHPGNAAIMPLAEEASKAGIKMMYQNVPVDEVPPSSAAAMSAPSRPAGQGARRGGGPPLRPGRPATCHRHERLVADRARGERELGHAPEPSRRPASRWSASAETEGLGTDPNVGIPVITAAIAANPDVKLIAYPGGQPLGNAATYMQAAARSRATSSTSASTPARRSSRPSRTAGYS